MKLLPFITATLLAVCLTQPAQAGGKKKVIEKTQESAAPASRQPVVPTPGSTWTEPVSGMEFVWVPSGCFQMGSTEGDDDEVPVHKVCLKGFYLGKYEVTQAQYQQVMGSNPSKFSGANNPVEQVSWNDTKNFIEELRYKGSQVRLPSEAEWEYACRAGGAHQQYCGGGGVIDRMAWYKGNSGQTTHPVGQLRPNDYGLYDMSGNVWEWVQDISYTGYNGAPSDGSAWEGGGAERVLRGGSWGIDPRFSRAANRGSSSPTNRNINFGFRLARTLP